MGLRALVETALAAGALLADQRRLPPRPNLKTKVEVRLIAEGKNRTRIELEHRYLDRYGARRDEVRGIFDSDMGWKRLLDAFTVRAAEGGRP